MLANKSVLYDACAIPFSARLTKSMILFSRFWEKIIVSTPPTTMQIPKNAGWIHQS